MVLLDLEDMDSFSLGMEGIGGSLKGRDEDTWLVDGRGTAELAVLVEPEAECDVVGLLVLSSVWDFSPPKSKEKPVPPDL